MHKAIGKLVWYEVWENIKKNYIYVFIVTLCFCWIWFREYKAIPYNLSMEYLIGFLILFSAINAKEMPLRVCKGAYVCPLDNKGKLYYLYARVGVRTIQNALKFILIALVVTGLSVLENEFLWYMFFFMLLIFSSFYFAMRLGKNEEEVIKIDEKGYRIQSKAEEMFRTGFGIILIIEWVCYIFVSGFFEADVEKGVILFLICLLINVVFAKKYTKPYLLELLAYEHVYSYKPKEEVVQYDI